MTELKTLKDFGKSPVDIRKMDGIMVIQWDKTSGSYYDTDDLKREALKWYK